MHQLCPDSETHFPSRYLINPWRESHFRAMAKKFPERGKAFPEEEGKDSWRENQIRAMENVWTHHQTNDSWRDFRFRATENHLASQDGCQD
jgi:hypothetical protein